VARILIIDDEINIRKPLQLLLTRAGHEVVSAANGTEGLRLWQEAPGDLVITDIHMPEKNGFETILELRQVAPDCRILAMSGSEADLRVDVLGNARTLGAIRTISKPFRLDEMLQAVQDVLSQAP
jgi:two-component system, chemotaxis family, chemotaxis protein CheY